MVISRSNQPSTPIAVMVLPRDPGCHGPFIWATGWCQWQISKTSNLIAPGHCRCVTPFVGQWPQPAKEKAFAQA